MNYRFYITIASSRVECFPLNFLKTSLVDQKEDGKAYYRRKFSGTLRFYCNTKIGTSDFDLLYYTEELIVSGALDCQEIIIEIEQKDSAANTYHNYWTGYFTTADGAWDLDNSTFDVTPLPYDDYRHFDINGDFEYNILDIATSVTTIAAGISYTRNRWLIDAIEFLADKMVTGIIVSSDFFSDTTNYVTGIASRVNFLTIAQKSDIKRPTSSGPATQAKLSFNEMMDILRIMFNVYWTFDGTTITIEHLSYFTKTDGLDLRTQPISDRSNKYSYDKVDMPKYEKFNWMESSDIAFQGVDIYYDSPCLARDAGSKEYSVPVTTDLEMIQLYEESISDDGFVILANYYDGSDYRVWFANAKYGSAFKYNMDLSWANLHDAFHRHGRVLPEGYMNNVLTSFASIIPTKIQEINAVVCYEDAYDPNDRITTELGEIYFDGEKGYVKSATISPTGQVKFSLLYGDTELGGESTPEPPTFWIVEDLTLHNNSYVYVYLNVPAPYDITFWIWVEETNCQEYVVLEGEMYHSELVDATIGMDPIEYGDLKYNLTSATLNDFTIKYSGDGCALPDDPAFPIIEITDADCGDAGGEVPPPVTPVVNISVKGGETWYIDNESGNIAIGSTTLSFTFMPHDCTVPGSHLIYIRVTRNAAVDAYSTVYAKELFQCNKSMTVTAAASGDVYDVELSEESWV